MSEFFAGLLCGILLVCGLISASPSYHQMAKKAKEECEKSLPRDRVCVVIAVPKAEALK